RTLGPGVKVQVQPRATLTDSGSVTFGASASVTFGYNGSTTQIVVGNGGVLTASGTAFTASGFNSNVTEIMVNAGGHLKANNSTFAIRDLYLDNGSVLNAGDLVGNAFDLVLNLPASEVQYLSGSGSDNLRFRDVEILPG